jgi:hypothetical protein
MSIGVAIQHFVVAGQGWVTSNCGIGWYDEEGLRYRALCCSLVPHVRYSFNGRVFSRGAGLDSIGKIRDGDTVGVFVDRDLSQVVFYHRRVRQSCVVKVPEMAGETMYATVNLMQPGSLRIIRAGRCSADGPYA